MTFSERMKDALEQTWAVSKDLASKAGAKAQDLGERGILMFEIKQLEMQAQKVLARLGTEVYTTFTEGGANTIDKEKAEIKAIIDELTAIKESIDRKDAELRIRKESK